MKMIRYGIIGIFVMIAATCHIAAQEKQKFQHHPIERQCIELARGTYAFVGYSSSNFGVIRTQNGYILIDTGDDLESVKAALQQIETLTSGSLQAIILTHSHPDHRGGADVFLEKAKQPVPVWAHPDFGAEQKTMAGLEHIASARFSRQFGNDIPDSLFTPNFMTPHFPNHQTGKLVVPDHFVQEGKTELNIDGTRLEIYTIPGESTDHIAIWLPDRQVLFCGDHVYGCFPNIYPIRGGAYRDVERWAKGVRRLLEFDAEAVMCGHNLVLKGEPIRTVFTDYAEAMEYVYNKTIEGMNAGKSPDELAAAIKLPEHLCGKPYLGEFYGAVAWAVKSIYAAKLGWFDGNPTHLFPLSSKDEAERMAKLAGGTGQLITAARTALTDKDYRWAMQLADYLVALREEEEGKNIKANAMRALSETVLPISGKNYLLQSALEMQNK